MEPENKDAENSPLLVSGQLSNNADVKGEICAAY